MRRELSEMTAEAMKARTREFGLPVVRLVQSLPNDRNAQRLGDQLLRCGTSVGAKYRAACRARSDAEFRAKLGIVEEEADEAAYWIELLIDAGYVRAELSQELLQEADEIVAIIVASINTSRKNK